jgi:uncharacterized protein YjbJ (UPF0337 family)
VPIPSSSIASLSRQQSNRYEPEIRWPGFWGLRGMAGGQPNGGLLPDNGDDMSDIGDKVSGKAKQAVGDIVGDRSLHREGRKEERKGDAKEEHARAEERAEAKAQEVANLERDTD